MNKILIKLLLIIYVIYLFPINLKANSLSKVNFVFDKMTYLKSEIVNLNINLDCYSNLSEIKMQIRIDTKYLEPITEDNQCCFFDNSSIYQNASINDLMNNSIIRLHLITNNSDGFSTNYKNNLCHLKFKTKMNIDNIYRYFTIDKTSNTGVSLYLFDNKDNLIEYEAYYLEKMKIEWSKESYTLNVFDTIPDFKKDIFVKNRNLDEYEYLIEKTIDTSQIGLKTIHIAIYDRLTADYIILSKAINIIDNISPVIKNKEDIIIKDLEIAKLDLNKYFEVSDNYDTTLETKFFYFDQKLNQIDTYDDFKNYLKSNQEGYIKYYACDSSKNICETEFIEVKIIDTTPPKINTINQITINDVEIEQLMIENFINIKDNYDIEPMIIVDYYDYNPLSFEEIKQLLKKGQKINFLYYGMDVSGNKTEEIACAINPIDTLAPTIELTDLLINDVDYMNFNIEQTIKIKDNFSFLPRLTKVYMIDEQEVTKEKFDELICKGQKGMIKYIAIDSFDNYSNEYIQNITICDTTIPVINIKNIKNNEKYIDLKQIEYEIYDNFNGCSIKVLLDNEVYIGQELSIGKHNFYIEAIDLASNKNEINIEFEIIEDNIIGCGSDVSCYINNYIEIVIISIILLFFVVGIILSHLIIKNKKEI